MSKRNLQLDILRGVAILLVFGRHLELPRPAGAVGLFADLWFRIGWLGVDLFFVLSGFLIGGLLVAELQRHGRIDITRFLVRRGLKIYPAYFVFLGYVALMPVLKTLLKGGDGGAVLAEKWHALWPNLLFLQNYIGTNPIGHTWTLAVEEHFYLLLPFALAALAVTGRIRWLVPLCALMVPVFLGFRICSVWTDSAFAVKMSATHLRLEALLFGVGIRGVAQYSPGRFQALRNWRSALVAAGILLWSPNLFIRPDTAVIRTVGLTATLLGAAAFLIAVYHTRAADFGRWRMLVSPVAAVVAWIGVYSYAIYLWHVTAMGILERQVGGRLFAWTGVATPLGWLLGMLLICTGAILAGVVASKAIEWPVLRLRDRFFPSRSGALPTASPPSQPATATACEVPATPALEAK